MDQNVDDTFLSVTEIFYFSEMVKSTKQPTTIRVLGKRRQSLERSAAKRARESLAFSVIKNRRRTRALEFQECNFIHEVPQIVLKSATAI